MVDAVEAEKIAPNIAHAIASLSNVRIRAVEAEMKLAEVEAFEERVAALEALVAERRMGGRRW